MHFIQKDVFIQAENKKIHNFSEKYILISIQMQHLNLLLYDVSGTYVFPPI